jgi:TolB-like protein
MGNEEPEAIGQGGRAPLPPPTPEATRTQLGRILASPEFQLPERGRAFLRYVVEESLAGRAKRIKAYSIAVEVFGRDEGITPDDPVVRIEAARLRRALERYYLVAGQRDPVRIDIPKGSYVPVFTSCTSDLIESPPVEGGLQPESSIPPLSLGPKAKWLIPTVLAVIVAIVGIGYWIFDRSTSQSSLRSPKATAPEAPTLVIIPFADLGEGAESKLYALGLTEELLNELPRFKELKVFGRETSEAISPQADASSIQKELGARYLLTGGVRVSGGRVRVDARVIETRTGAILWSRTYNEDLRSRDLIAIQSEVAGKVASAVAQPYGVIFSADVTHSQQSPPDDLDAYLCTLRFYAYRADLRADKHAEARDCLETAIVRFPTFATAWAMLSIAYLDEDRFLFNSRTGSSLPLTRALEAARRAVKLDPENARAQQALMLALFFNGQLAESLRVGEEALVQNPNDTELMSEFGIRVAMSGQWRRGEQLLEEALARNPGNSDYYHGALALTAYMQQNDEKALSELRQADLQEFPLFHLVGAVILAELGLAVEATREGETFNRLRPDFPPNVKAELAKRNIPPEDQVRIIAGMRKLSLPVPTDIPEQLSPPSTTSDSQPHE